MERIAIVGDVHFNRKAENPIIKQHIKDGQLRFFDYLVDTLKDRGIKTILITGDLHDTRVILDVESIVTTRRLLKDKLKDFEIHIILGNHDLYFENSYDISALELFEDIPNVTIYRKNVVKKVFVNKEWYLFPWIIADNEESTVNFLKKLGEKSQEKKDNTVIFGHFDMFGVDMEGNGNLSPVGIDPNLFIKAARLTLSGHYHGKTRTNKSGNEIIYVGSPYPMTFASANSNHGFWILDEEFNMEFIENVISPSFKDVWDTDDFDVLGDLTNSFVRLYISDKWSLEELFELRMKIENKNPLIIKKIPYDGINKTEVEKVEIQQGANKLLGMDTVRLSELYIDHHIEELPKLKLENDSKQAVLKRVNEYKELLNIS